MKTSQIATLIAVLILLGGLIAAKSMTKPAPPITTAPPPVTAALPAAPPAATPSSAPTSAPGSADKSVDRPASGQSLPRLIELGSTTCIPCQQMAPILEELKTELQGKVSVEFIDVYRDPTAADKFGIEVIPTQVFLDATGKELFRHTGVFEKADILAKMRELQMIR